LIGKALRNSLVMVLRQPGVAAGLFLGLALLAALRQVTTEMGCWQGHFRPRHGRQEEKNRMRLTQKTIIICK
jgi:hypothetical protein